MFYSVMKTVDLGITLSRLPDFPSFRRSNTPSIASFKISMNLTDDL